MKNRERFQKQWPFKWWGYDGLETLVTPETFQVEDILDFDWNPPDKAKIVEYLKNTPVLLLVMVPAEPCGLCEDELDQVGDCSDEVWMWPARLWHDVEKHGAFLPDAMVEHIRKCNYQPLLTGTLPLEDHPFPMKDVGKLGFRLSNGELVKRN